LLNELDLITLFRITRIINYIKKTMSKKNIQELKFNELLKKFSDDIIIKKFLNDRIIIGIDKKDKIFEHSVSENVIIKFFEIFGDSKIVKG